MIPPMHPAAVLTAVISAALFAAAIVFAVRRRSTDIETPLTAVLTGEGRLLERELFASALLERRFSPLGPAISLVWHLVIIGGTPLLPYLFPQKLSFDARRYHVRMMEFRIPAPLLYTPPAKPSAATAAARRSSKPRLESAPAGRRDPARYALEAPNRPRLQLPWTVRAPSKDVIIQPDESPQISIAPHPLPSAFLWAQAPAPLELSRVVGATETPRPAFSLPRSTPALQRPNREIAVSDLQIGAASIATFRPPQLPVPPANVSPVRVPSSPLESSGELPATALPPGSLMNLIALMRSPAPPAFGYLLEAGNLLAGSQAAGQPGAPRSGSSAGTAQNGSGSGPGGDSLSAKGTHADLLRATAGAGSDKAGENAAAPNPDAGAKASTQPAPTGNLGIIIVQPSSQESILDGGDTLTGQPVYTVYFDVPGAPRRWVLQYCVPGSASPPSVVASSEGVVRIVPKRTVQPPYPIERIPVDVKSFQGDARRLVLYATVNERGETENVRVIRGTGNEIDSAAVATLKRWAFRPAMRGDAPVAVEALFGIPLQ